MPDLGGLIQHLADKLHDALVNVTTSLPDSTIFAAAPVVVWQVDLGECPGQHRYWRRVDDFTAAAAPDYTSYIQQSDDGSTWTNVLTGGIGPLPTNIADVERWVAGMASDALGWVTHHFGLQVCPANPTITAPAPDVASPPQPDRITNNPAGPSVVLTPTDEEPPGGTYGAHCRWLDLSGRYRVTWFYADSYDSAVAIKTALAACSTAALVEFWAAPVLQITGEVNPEHQAYALAADEVRLAVEFGGSLHESLTLPAPRDDLFLADQLTLNVGSGDAALLVSEITGHLYSPLAAAVATGVAAASIRSREAPGGTL